MADHPHWSTLKLEVAERTAILTIDRPDALNALNSTVLAELEQAVDHIRDRTDVGVLIITGGGTKAFVAGADIKEMVTLPAIAARTFTALGQRVNAKIEDLPQPVIMAVNGYALGGGWELALAGDIRLASDNAVFGLPEVGLGLHPGFGGTQRLLKLVGKGKASELIFTCDRIKADEAHRLGIVNALYPQAELLPAAKALAAKINKQAPIAVMLAKAALTRGNATDLTTGLRYENETAALCFSTEDIREGFTAFIEKRPPRFVGK